MDVSIVIINYNTYDLTSECVASVIEYTKDINYEIIVVDNGSKDFKAENFQQRFPPVILVLSQENLGFAGGNNLGIQKTTGKYILLLNSDTLFKENVAAQLYQYMEQHDRAAVVSPKLVHPDGRVQSVCQRFPSVKQVLFELLRLQKVFAAKGSRFLLGAFFDHNSAVKPDWVWGACFFFRKRLLDLLPGQKLDDKFFMYCEDMQWCYDFRKLGYEIHYNPQLTVVHFMGGSSGNKKQMNNQNRNSFLDRNYNAIHKNLILGLENLLTPK